jgi:amino acid transporter
VNYSLSTAAAPAHDLRLAKVLGVLAVTASAVAAEYGAGINFVSTQSLGVYPGIHGLVPLAMFVTGILMLPKTYLFVVFSRVMPRAGSKYVWHSKICVA